MPWPFASIMKMVACLKRHRTQIPLSPDESIGPARPGEVRPPWIEYPGFGPADFVWREVLENWRFYVWDPYYASLNEEAKAEYLRHWKVPEDWWNFHFNPEWRAFLDHIDDSEE